MESSGVTQEKVVVEQIRALCELDGTVERQEFQNASRIQNRLQDLAGPGGQVPKVGRKCFAGRTVFVAGANGRLGSRVVRMLLRRGCRVRAAVRGTEKVEDYSRLSYEIGAEEGLGDIQAPWVRKSVEMTATEEMKEYGLGQLIVVECDLMDEKNVARAVKGVDAVVFCAGSFDRGRLAIKAPEIFTPDALFRVTDRIFLESKREEDRQKAAASSGAVDGYADREGVEIVAKAFFKDRQLRAMSGTSIPKKDDAVALNEFVLVSSIEGALFSSLPLFSLEKQQVVDVQDVKREGEELLRKQGLQSNVVLRMARFDDNFTPEGLPLKAQPSAESAEIGGGLVINRVDAALATVMALIADKGRGYNLIDAWTNQRDWRDI